MLDVASELLGAESPHMIEPVAGSGTSLPIGVGILAFAAFTAILGTVRYHAVRRALERGELSSSHWTITLLAGLIVALALVLMGYLVASSSAR
jgi:uncharacterized membrane protein YidH (DUF202 family)